MNDELNVGNISTLATWISIILYPLVVKYGIEIDKETVTTFVYTTLVIIIAIWSSYNPNTFAFLNNNKQEQVCEEGIVESEADLINEEYNYEEDFEV